MDNKSSKRNISILKDCYGCGVCVAVCPTKIISLRENQDGFYSPAIDNDDKCINCGLCLKVCAFNHSEVCTDNNQAESFAAWSNDENTRMLCSSGGVGFEIGKHLLKNGYKACGVRYDVASARAMHYIASDVKEFRQSIGSKYIPSQTSHAFSEINRKEKYFVTGTPCQIDSFRRYIKHFKAEDNFILLDFFCHGTPSLLLWNKYLSEVEPVTGRVSYVSWRNKLAGWHDSWNMFVDGNNCKHEISAIEPTDWHESYALQIRGKKNMYFSQLSKGDLFFKFFLENVCLNTCCYNCKYKMQHSAADIRIGDLWGTAYASDTKGTSAVLALTPRGRQTLHTLESCCTFVPEPLSIVMEGQMPHSPKYPWVRTAILNAFRSTMPLRRIAGKWLRVYALSTIPKRALRKLWRIATRQK